MKLATRVGQVSPSLTLAIDAKAKAMKAEGVDVCSFSAGEPDFEQSGIFSKNGFSCYSTTLLD